MAEFFDFIFGEAWTTGECGAAGGWLSIHGDLILVWRVMDVVALFSGFDEGAIVSSRLSRPPTEPVASISPVDGLKIEADFTKMKMSNGLIVAKVSVDL